MSVADMEATELTQPATRPRKRVLFIINSLAGGGAERVMCTLLHYSKAECAEFDVTLALLDDEPAAHSPPDWVHLRQLDCRKSTLRSAPAVRRLIADIRPDVTVSFLTRSNVASVLSATSPCVISERANTSAHFPNTLGGMISRAMIRAVYPRATRIIAVSEGVAEDLRDNFAVPPGKLISIPNPVDVDAIESRASEAPEIAIDGPYILAAGRLVKSKNFDLLIRAYARYGGTPKLVIMGEGPLRDALAATTRECGVEGRVLFPGFIANPYALMRRAKFFVLSSNAEGFPNALVEAMATRAAVIATNCASGPSEILAEASRAQISALTFAKHGVLTPPNDVAAMADAMAAMSNDAMRRDYATKARARAGAFSAEAAKDRYWAVIREAMAAAR